MKRLKLIKKQLKKFSTNVNESKSTSVSDKQDKFKNVKHTKVPKSFENRRQGKTDYFASFE